MSNLHHISLTSAFSKPLFHATDLEFILTKIEADNLKNKLSIIFTSFISLSKRSVIYIFHSFISDTGNMSTTFHF